ncbi:MAG: right-handed parallel beta-helix repeat-containing protein, partial [Methylocella sp.]
MKILGLLLAMIAATIMATLFGAPAYAQATRTWVSGVGDDANPCSRTAPCKTFAGAISKTAPHGEIDCLDPGGFGALTITKALTILCEPVSNGGVLVSGTNAIVAAA